MIEVFFPKMLDSPRASAFCFKSADLPKKDSSNFESTWLLEYAPNNDPSLPMHPDMKVWKGKISYNLTFAHLILLKIISLDAMNDILEEHSLIEC
mmetsp:Transcript_59044/g.67239  ORF Transcript_59044/g.67239 Transcript_59044/m.67239 type:complete len:95 (-) Transcript_59044:364-648(-)